jgi:hypothetical protein
LADLGTKAVLRGYPLDGPADVALEAAIAIAQRTSGLALCSSGPAGRLADELYADWLCFGGACATETHREWPIFPLVAGALDDILITDPHSDSSSAPVDWDTIRKSLTERGLIIEDRASQSALLSGSSLCSVVEIRDNPGKVLAEGKGLTQGEALIGVLGEAVERLVAQLPNPNRLFLATAREITAAGLGAPNLTCEARDLFSPDLPLEWVSAETLSGGAGALPAELVYYPFQPSTAIKAFSVQHTAGLAAGNTIAAASAAALREAIETDAYWLSMRCMRICSRFDALADAPAPEVRRLVRSLAEVGVRTHAGLISFDWPVPIVHVVLETVSESLPALSHGLALSADPYVALQRALLEAIQVFTGLEKVSRHYWPEISVGLSRTADPPLLWSDPNYARRIVEMFENAPPVDLAADTSFAPTLKELAAWMKQKGMTGWLAHLGSQGGLEVVRAYIEGGVSAFSERGRPSPRLNDMLSRYGLRFPYLDPVLT